MVMTITLSVSLLHYIIICPLWQQDWALVPGPGAAGTSGLDTSASVDCHVHCHQFIIVGHNWSQKHPARAIHEQKSSSTSGQCQ